jgi:hypothetical protein
MRWSEIASRWIRDFTSSLGRMIPSEESATFRDHAVKARTYLHNFQCNFRADQSLAANGFRFPGPGGTNDG